MNIKAQAGTSVLQTLVVTILVAFLVISILTFVLKLNPLENVTTPKAVEQNLETIENSFKGTGSVLTLATKESDTYAVFDQDHNFITITKEDNSEVFIAKPSQCGSLYACAMYCEQLIDIEDKHEEFFCAQVHTKRFTLGKGLKTPTQQGGIIVFSNELQIDNNGIRLKEEGMQMIGYTDEEYEHTIEDNSVKGVTESFLQILMNYFDRLETLESAKLETLFNAIFENEMINAVEISSDKSGNIGYVCISVFNEKNEQIYPPGDGSLCYDNKIDEYNFDSALCVGNPMHFEKGKNIEIIFEYDETTKTYTAVCNP